MSLGWEEEGVSSTYILIFTTTNLPSLPLLSYPLHTLKILKKKGLFFISTPLDIPSAKFLGKFVDCIKIASADIDYYPLIEVIKKFM